MGAVRFEITSPMAERVLARAVEEGVRFESVSRTGARSVRAWVKGADEKAFCAFLSRFSIAYRVTGRRGWSRARRFLRARLALFACIAASLALLFAFSGRVWRVTVTGGGPEMYAMLARYGVRAGVARADINELALSKRLLADAPEYAFIGVKVSGVFLRVEAVRADAPPPVYAPEDARDLLASADGVVLRVNVTAGQARVKAGDTVRAGDVLIAGEERKTADGETARVRAEGSVIARTWTRATCAYALSREEIRFTGRESTAARLESPLFTRALYGNNPFARCAETEETLAVAGLFFPMKIVRETFREYETVRADVPAEEAEACARAHALALAREKAPADAAEQKTWTDIQTQNGTVTATAAVEWTREITCEALGGKMLGVRGQNGI